MTSITVICFSNAAKELIMHDQNLNLVEYASEVFKEMVASTAFTHKLLNSGKVLFAKM